MKRTISWILVFIILLGHPLAAMAAAPAEPASSLSVFLTAQGVTTAVVMGLLALSVGTKLPGAIFAAAMLGLPLGLMVGAVIGGIAVAGMASSSPPPPRPIASRPAMPSSGGAETTLLSVRAGN